MSLSLHSLPRERRLHIRRGEPIEECGLTLYPIRMDRYEDFLQCKDALTLRLSSLPARIAALDYMSAVFALELEAIRGKAGAKESGGIFFRLMRLIGLSLRKDMTAEAINECIYYRSSGENDIQIDHLVISQGGGAPVSLTPFDFSSRIRPLIAVQNAIDLPDEAENAELVEANEIKKRIGGGVALKMDMDDLVSSVAYASRVSDAEIMNWSVRDFENRQRAIDRDKRYMMYGQAELGGLVTFKNGNPYPSWRYDAADDSLGTTAFDDLAKTLSQAASPGA